MMPVRMSAPMRTLTFAAFGVCAQIRTDSEAAFARLPEVVPPAWRSCRFQSAEREILLLRAGEGLYALEPDPIPPGAARPLAETLDLLATELRLHVAINAPTAVFVHAGAVAHAGRAIVIPGESFSGKSTLVAALVRAGAEYLSDEFAVLDQEGAVHPFPKRISLRDDRRVQTHLPIESLGGRSAAKPYPVGLVIVTSFRPRGAWKPERLSPGAGVLALAAHAVQIRDRPQHVLSVLRRAVAGAIVLTGERGDAGPVACAALRTVADLV